MKHAIYVFSIATATVLIAAAKDDTANRVRRAASVFNSLTDSGHGIRSEQLALADCVAVIPGFKKGAAVIGVGYGRGFISCRKANGWSAPAAITLESGSVGVQIGGEVIDIVILSFDQSKRSKLLSDRFTVGSDASAAWGNGRSAHEDRNATIVFYGHTKDAFAGFDLDGATVKPDASGNTALYGKAMNNGEIVESANTPVVARPLISELTQKVIQ